MMKIVGQIKQNWDSEVWLFEKAKMLDFPLTVLKTISNCREKLNESCHFEKTRHLADRKYEYSNLLLIKFSSKFKMAENWQLLS